MRQLRRHAGTLGAAAGLGLLLVAIPHFTYRTYGDLTNQTFGHNIFGYPVKRGSRVFYLGSEPVAKEARKLVVDLPAQAKPGQRLFVGTADLRKTPYSDAYLYYLMPELTPSTYYIEMDPGVANAKGSGLAKEVANSDWLVLSHVWDHWIENNDSRKLGPDEPNEVVRRQFCLVKDYGGAFGCTAAAVLRPDRPTNRPAGPPGSCPRGRKPGPVTSPMRVLVVVPTYQEADNVTPFLTRVRDDARCRHPRGRRRQPRRHRGAGREGRSRPRQIQLLHRSARKGLGSAYRAGFGQALADGYDVIVQMDCDFSHDPAVIPRLIAPLDAGEADCVIGSRYVPGGSTPNWPMHRAILSSTAIATRLRCSSSG